MMANSIPNDMEARSINPAGHVSPVQAFGRVALSSRHCLRRGFRGLWFADFLNSVYLRDR